MLLLHVLLILQCLMAASQAHVWMVAAASLWLHPTLAFACHSLVDSSVSLVRRPNCSLSKVRWKFVGFFLFKRESIVNMQLKIDKLQLRRWHNAVILCWSYKPVIVGFRESGCPHHLPTGKWRLWAFLQWRGRRTKTQLLVCRWILSGWWWPELCGDR